MQRKPKVHFIHHYRSKNKAADLLANLAMDKKHVGINELRNQTENWIKNDLEPEIGKGIDIEWGENSKCITLEDTLLDQCEIDWLKS